MELAGQCGGSMFPVTKENLDLAKGLLAIGTLSFPDDMENWTSAKNCFDYASHIRSESAGLIDAVKEAIEIGRRAGVPVWISHHKAAGCQYWGDVQETLRLIDEANQSGIQVTLDQYPYDANMTNLNICIPPKYFENGGVEAMVSALKDPDMRKQIREDMIKADCGYDNFYQNAGGFEHIFISGCPNVKEADGCCRSLEEMTHPRTFATFPKALRFYHKDCGIFNRYNEKKKGRKKL